MNVCFVIWNQHQIRFEKIKAIKTQQISVTTQILFVKTELQHIQLQRVGNHFVLFSSTFFSEIIIPLKNQ